MPGQHAFLSASAAHRWINCPPSAKICAEIAEKEGEGSSVLPRKEQMLMSFANIS